MAFIWHITREFLTLYMFSDSEGNVYIFFISIIFDVKCLQTKIRKHFAYLKFAFLLNKCSKICYSISGWLSVGQTLGENEVMLKALSSDLLNLDFFFLCVFCYNQGCSYGGRRPGGAAQHSRFPPGTTQKIMISARHNFFFFFFFLVPGTMFHNRGSIIAQYTYVIYIENDLVRLWIPAGALPLDPRSLALCFIGFTHSACHYYSQLFSHSDWAGAFE